MALDLVRPSPSEEYEQPVEPEQAHALVGGEVDVQVATARRYPRSVHQFMQEAEGLVSISEDVAGQCFYVLPARRGGDGKSIEGPSARFAEIITYSWKHMRVEGRPIREEDRFIVCRGTAWDLEANVAKAFEVRRRITNSKGERYSDDMVSTTGLACMAIACRNAVLAIIPRPFWERAYLKAKSVAVGKAETLAARRSACIESFAKMAVSADRIYAMLGVNGVEEVSLDHLLTLRGLFTAIKEGNSTVDEVFPASLITGPRRKSEQLASPPGTTNLPGVGVGPTDPVPAVGSVTPAVIFVKVTPTKKPKPGESVAEAVTKTGEIYQVGSVELLPYLSTAVEQGYAVEISVDKGQIVELSRIME